MDRLTSMSVFVTVVDQGSFSAAAEQLQLSRATTSKHIAALENCLGGRLLNRTTRRISLTEAGQATMNAAGRYSKMSRTQNAW